MKNPTKNPIQYTLYIQQLSVGSFIVSSIILLSLLFLADPTSGFWVMASFLFFLGIILTSIANLFAFWWFFFFKKEIISISQVHKIVGQSLISSVILISLLVMQQTKQLNIATFIVLCAIYLLYQAWAWSE